MEQESDKLSLHSTSKKEVLASKQLDISSAVLAIYISLEKEFRTAAIFCQFGA
jgi:hypothetical protein